MSRGSDRGRLTAGVSTLGLVVTILVLQATTAAPAAASVLFVQPTGIGGLPATVTGSGFEDVRVSLCWDRAGCSNLGQDTPVLGTFTTDIIVPEGAAPGQHSIYACQSGSCSSAVIEVIGSDTTTTTTATTPTTETTTTTLSPTTSTTLSPTTSTPATTPTTSAATTTTTSLGATTSVPSRFPTSTAGPDTTLVGPSPVGAPTTSLPAITGTTDHLGEGDQDEGEDEAQLGAGSDADPPTPILDAVMSGVFSIDPPTSSEDQLVTGPLDAATPIPEPSSDSAPQDEPLAKNRAPADFPMPDIGMWVLWLAVTVSVSAFALTFDAVRQRRSR